MHAYQKSLRKSKEVGEILIQFVPFLHSYFFQNFDNYMYYGAGLISAIDKYPEIEKNLTVQTKKHVPKPTNHARSPLYHPEILEDIPVSSQTNGSTTIVFHQIHIYIIYYKIII